MKKKSKKNHANVKTTEFDEVLLKATDIIDTY